MREGGGPRVAGAQAEGREQERAVLAARGALDDDGERLARREVVCADGRAAQGERAVRRLVRLRLRGRRRVRLRVGVKVRVRVGLRVRVRVGVRVRVRARARVGVEARARAQGWG